MKMIDRLIIAVRDTGMCEELSVEDMDIIVTAMLEALREPTPAMDAAGAKYAWLVDDTFRAMIDAALEE